MGATLQLRLHGAEPMIIQTAVDVAKPVDALITTA